MSDKPKFLSIELHDGMLSARMNDGMLTTQYYMTPNSCIDAKFAYDSYAAKASNPKEKKRFENGAEQFSRAYYELLNAGAAASSSEYIAEMARSYGVEANI